MCKLSSILTENEQIKKEETRGNSKNKSNSRNVVKYPVKKSTFSRRSRTGCLTCRHRRIKCDERKPFCFNCEKSKKTCSGFDHVKKSLMKIHLNAMDTNDTDDTSGTNESGDKNNNDKKNNVNSEKNSKLPPSILPVIMQATSPNNQYLTTQLNDTGPANDSLNDCNPIIYYSQPSSLDQIMDRDKNLNNRTKTFSNGYNGYNGYDGYDGYNGYNGYNVYNAYNGYDGYNGYISNYGYNYELQMLPPFQQTGQFSEPIQRFSVPQPYSHIPM